LRNGLIAYLVIYVITGSHFECYYL